MSNTWRMGQGTQSYVGQSVISSSRRSFPHVYVCMYALFRNNTTNYCLDPHIIFTTWKKQLNLNDLINVCSKAIFRHSFALLLSTVIYKCLICDAQLQHATFHAVRKRNITSVLLLAVTSEISSHALVQTMPSNCNGMAGCFVSQFKRFYSIITQSASPRQTNIT